MWRLPVPIPPCTHPYKYRAVFAMGGQRMIGFDNERGKGDHCRIGGQERLYRFTGVDQLVEDFIAEVQRWRTERSE